MLVRPAQGSGGGGAGGGTFTAATAPAAQMMMTCTMGRTLARITLPTDGIERARCSEASGTAATRGEALGALTVSATPGKACERGTEASIGIVVVLYRSCAFVSKLRRGIVRTVPDTRRQAARCSDGRTEPQNVLTSHAPAEGATNHDRSLIGSLEVTQQSTRLPEI